MVVHIRHMCTKGAQPWLFTFDTDTADNIHPFTAALLDIKQWLDLNDSQDTAKCESLAHSWKDHPLTQPTRLSMVVVEQVGMVDIFRRHGWWQTSDLQLIQLRKLN